MLDFKLSILSNRWWVVRVRKCIWQNTRKQRWNKMCGCRMTYLVVEQQPVRAWWRREERFWRVAAKGESRRDIKVHSGPKFRILRLHLSLSSIREWASRAKGHCSLYAINVVPMTLFLELLRGLCLSLPFSFPLLTDTQYAGFDVLLQCFTAVNLHRSRCLLHTDGLEPKVVWEAASKAYILGQKELFVLSFIIPSTIVDTK